MLDAAHVLLEQPKRGLGAVAADAIRLAAGKEAQVLQRLLHVFHSHRSGRGCGKALDLDAVAAGLDFRQGPARQSVELLQIRAALRFRHLGVNASQTDHIVLHGRRPRSQGVSSVMRLARATPSKIAWPPRGNGAAARQGIASSDASDDALRPARVRFELQDLPEVRGEFVDGGVSTANNPSLQLVLAAIVTGYGFGWQMDEDRLAVTSVGTGRANTQLGLSTGLQSVAAAHGIKALSSVLEDCADLVETMMQWMSRSLTARELDGNMGTLEGCHRGGGALPQPPKRYNVHFEPAVRGRRRSPRARILRPASAEP
ncbi:MAG: hypothetical protein ABIQ06_10625 [Caldimonas sp.]